MRACGGCTLCCKLLPVKELNKLAGERCKFQRTGKGCTIHEKPGYPKACGAWSCAWLTDPDTSELSRPDRSHYVIDSMPDFVTLSRGPEVLKIPVLQIWCDPDFPDAHKDPALRRALDLGGHVALIRYGSKKGLALFPPSVTGEPEFIEQGGQSGEEHSLTELMDVLKA